MGRRESREMAALVQLKDSPVLQREGGKTPLSPEPLGSKAKQTMWVRFLKNKWVFGAILGLSILVVGVALHDLPFPGWLQLPVGEFLAAGFDAFNADGRWFYQPLGGGLNSAYLGLLAILEAIAAPVIVAVFLLGLTYFKGVGLGALSAVLFAWVIATGLWDRTLEMIAFMAIAVSISGLVGLLLGFIASLSAPIHSTVRAGLDVMQSFPSFVYFVPFVILFGANSTAAMLVTIIWAVPPLARMTSVGLRSVSPETVESVESLGANRGRLLWDVRLPLAGPSIRAGVNQLIMYAVAMATFAAMVGAPGLGAPVWSGLSRLSLGDALEAGIAVVLLAVLLDRATSPGSNPPARTRFRTVTLLSALAIVVLATQVFRGPWSNFSEPSWGRLISLRDPVDALISWSNVTLGPFLTAFSEAVQLYVLNVLGGFFQALPWPLVVLAVALLGVLLVSKIFGLFAALGVILICSVGMWDASAETLAVVVSAVLISVVLGLPLGVLMSSSEVVAGVLRPILDVLQTMPLYLFVIPAVMLFGIGEVAGTLATIIASMPPMIRLTNAALRNADTEVVEAATISGASRMQILTQVRIPLGIQLMLVGLNQAIIIALSMVVISGLVGAPGLGQEIFTSVMYIDLGLGINAGLAMLILAMVIDRLVQGSVTAVTTSRHTSTTRTEKE